MNEPRVVALLGYAQSGKDEAAKVLVEEGGFVRVAFADAVRECLLALDPLVQVRQVARGREMVDRGEVAVRHVSELVRDYGWDPAKTLFPDVRRLLQRLGTEVVRDRIDKDAWAKIGAEKIENARYDGRPVVLTDVRFMNEAKSIWSASAGRAEFFLVDRPGIGPVNGHVSDSASFVIAEEHRATTLYNSGTLAEWHDTVRREILGAAVK
jgi:dephospho-CoA kinase